MTMEETVEWAEDLLKMIDALGAHLSKADADVVQLPGLQMGAIGRAWLNNALRVYRTLHGPELGLSALKRDVDQLIRR